MAALARGIARSGPAPPRSPLSEFCPVIRPTACCPFGMRQVAVVADANEPAPPQRKIEFQAIAAGDDGAMQMGQAGESDHGIDDLLPV